MSRCEDYPCCGHEAGDCDGSLYGSDESIMAHARRHAYCDHEAGYCELEDDDDLGEEESDDDGLTDVEADAMTLTSAGWGTDEDYGFFGPDE